MATSGFPGPFFVATVALLGGGGVWFTIPSHQAMAHDRFEAFADRIHQLETKLGGGRVAGNLKQLLHKFDKDRSGRMNADELRAADANLFGADGDQGFWTTQTVVGTVAMNIALAVLLLAVTYLLNRPAGLPANPIGILEVSIVRGTGLLNVDEKSGIKGDLSDPYVEAYVGGSKFKTSTIKDNLNPEWKEKDAHTHKFAIDLRDKKKGTLSLYVFDAKDHMKMTEVFSKAKSLGHAEVDIADTFATYHGQHITKRVPLTIDHVNAKDSHVTYEQHGELTISGIWNSTPEKHL